MALVQWSSGLVFVFLEQPRNLTFDGRQNPVEVTNSIRLRVFVSMILDFNGWH